LSASTRIRRFLDKHRSAVLAFGYFLFITLLRKSPYWSHGITLTWPMGVALALLPLLPGIAKRRLDWLFAGYIIALFTPYQTGVASASMLLIAVLVSRHFKELPSAIRPRGALFPLALYLLYLCAQWVAGYGVEHTPFSIAASVLITIATPVAVLLLCWRLAQQEEVEHWLDLAVSIIVAEALVIVLLPLCIGKPVLLASVVNGMLKPVYTVLGIAHTFPWYDPDWNQGSISIVNYSTVVMTLGAMHCFARLLRTRRMLDAAVLALLVFAAFMGENAMAVGAAGAAFATTLLIAAALRFTGTARSARGANIRTALVLALIVAGLWGFLQLTYLGHGAFAGTQKGRYYETVGARMSERPLRLFFGYGAGAYGSRVAYTRMGEDPYQISTQLQRVYHIGPRDTLFAASDYAHDFREAGMQRADWIGSSQGSMVSGLIAGLFENGAIGMLLLLLLLWPGLRVGVGAISEGLTADAAVAWIAIYGPVFLLCLSVFFNYNEIPTAAAILLLPIGLFCMRSSLLCARGVETREVGQ
jgi:hypothetical protein